MRTLSYIGGTEKPQKNTFIKSTPTPPARGPVAGNPGNPGNPRFRRSPESRKSRKSQNPGIPQIPDSRKSPNPRFRQRPKSRICEFPKTEIPRIPESRIPEIPRSEDQLNPPHEISVEASWPMATPPSEISVRVPACNPLLSSPGLWPVHLSEILHWGFESSSFLLSG